MSRISHYYRCPECPERFLISYDIMSILWDFWSVQAEKARVETEFANHQADCINARVEVLLGQI